MGAGGPIHGTTPASHPAGMTTTLERTTAPHLGPGCPRARRHLVAQAMGERMDGIAERFIASSEVLP